MEDIKIGEYIRTKKGTIAKVLAYQDLTTYNDKGTSVTFHSFDTDKGAIADVETEKHSKNIKDLIEAGDFINGMQVDEFDDEEGTVLGIPVYEDGLFNTLNFYIPIESINIKTILTREKFESECFKVEEGQDV